MIRSYFGLLSHAVLLAEGTGLASLYCWPDGRPAVQLWRSVFEPRAPSSITAVPAAAGAEIGRGNMIQTVTDELLEALYQAYRVAKAGA